MQSLNKIKNWIEENAPMFAKLYQNKYVGMAYDRFASLPVRSQKQVLIGTVSGIGLLIFLIIFSAYLSLWSYKGKAADYHDLVNLLVEYQKNLRDKSPQLQAFERNSQLANAGAFKQYLQEQGRNSSISPRMMQIEEKQGEGESKEKESKKQATVKLQKVNLEQLRNFFQNLEYGTMKLSVLNFKISNDDKIRGYMNVDVTVEAQFLAGEGSGT